MLHQEEINAITNELKRLQPFGIILFGSTSKGTETSRSDIDVAILSGSADQNKNRDLFRKMLEVNRPPFDVKIFELLPIHVQMDIQESYKVLLGDPLEIAEYFYLKRRIWKDIEIRMRRNAFTSIDEQMSSLGFETKE